MLPGETMSLQARSLWIGDIESWMDENYIVKSFMDYGNIIL